MTFDERSRSAELRRRFAVSANPSLSGAVDVVQVADPGLTGRSLMQAAVSLRGSVVGLGRLEPIARDPSVTDICVNGPGEVWMDTGDGMTRSGLAFDSADELRALACRLAAAGGQRLDDAMPYADVRLADGVRVHAILPPLVPAGVHLSLRFPARRRLSLDDLVRLRAVPLEGAEVLLRLITSAKSFLVTGGTGTGKTTVLGCLLSQVPTAERIVTVEDLAELQIGHPHVVRLEARRPNAEGRGEVSVGELVRQSLRMRPDRLVVGEARGAEITDLLAALNTGHVGGCGTLHADRPESVLARIEALASLGGWSAETARRQLIAAVEMVVHLRRRSDGHRYVDSVARLTGHGDEVGVEAVWRSPPEAADSRTPALFDPRVVTEFP